MILILISLLVVLYIMYWLRVMEGKFAQPRAVRCQRYPRNRQWEEFFDEEESSEQQTATDPPPLADVSPPMASLNIQDAIDFSDVYVTEQSKDECCARTKTNSRYKPSMIGSVPRNGTLLNSK